MSDGRTDLRTIDNSWHKMDLDIAIKHDAEKTEYHYMSPVAIEQLNRVLSFGAKKYASHNWRAGFKWSRVLSAAFRHLFAWMAGQDKDPETGISHLAHAMCCIMFLLEFETTHPELDDRYKGSPL